MRIRLAIPDNIIDGPTIDAALEAVTRGNEALAARGMLPDMGEALANGLKWKPEPWLGERFDLAPDAAARNWGDCDDLAPWLAAQLRAAGEQARAFARKSGKNKWHVQVERGDGQILDPSEWAGMPTSAKGKDLVAMPHRSVAGQGESSICAVPWNGRWHVRADMPLTERLHVAGWARDPDVMQALERAVATYAAVAEGCHGIGDATVGFGLGDIVSAVAPMAGTALGGPLGGLLASQLAPMAGGIVDSAMGSLGGMLGGLGGGGGRPAPAAPPSGDAVGRPPPIKIPGPLPDGWPSGAVTHQIPGPAGGGEARVTHSPGGGPIIVRF